MKKQYTIARLLICVAVLFLGVGLTTYAQSSQSQYARKGADKVLNNQNQSNKGYTASATNSERIDLATKYQLDGQMEKAQALNKSSNSATQNRAAGSSTSTQNKSSERCSTTDAYNQRLQDPSYQEYVKDWQAKISASKLQKLPCDATNSIVIPIAVHFDAAFNCDNVSCIIDATQAQVQVINDDFAATNSDLNAYTNILAACGGGASVASDGACISFCLANQNHPAGSGLVDGDLAITVGEYTGGFGAGGGGAPDWPGYLNIFVVDGFGGGVADGIPGALNGDGVTVGGGVFGGPNFGPCTSGAVIDDGAGIGWDLGRTLTHEIGHYLGLYHVWGDVNGGGCGGDDMIADTPDQAGPSGGCPTNCATLATCNAGEFAQYNFMDYFDDPCLVMFSEGQALVMNAFSNSVTWANDAVDTGCSDFSESSLFNCSLSVAFAPADGTAITVCLDDGGLLSFTDASVLATSWTWDFAVTSGDLVLGSATSTMQNPTPAITGGTSGTIEVTLTACDDAGNCEVVVQSYPITAATGAACPDECDFVLDLTDTFGDGWNGATVEIFQDGVSVGVYGGAFTDGTNDGPYTIPLTDGSTIDVVQTNGGFPGEEGFTLVDPFGFPVASLTGGAPVSQTFVASCSVPTCSDGIQNANETGIDCGGTDCPTCCGNGIQDADETGLDCGGADCPACPACAAGDIEIVNENFDACDIPAGWSVTSTGGGSIAGGDFIFTAPPGGVPSGGAGPPGDFAGCIAVIDDDANDAIGVGCILTDIVDLTAYINSTLTFDWQHEAVAGGGEFIVQVWDGTMWVTVFSADDDSNGNNQTVSLDQYANPNFQVQFCYDDEGGFQWGAGIDNVSICGQANNVCPTTFVPTDASGDYCAGSDIDLVAPGNPNVTYTWSSSSADVVIADPAAAVTTATLNTSSLCAADAVTISLNAICTIDGSVQFDGVVSTVNVFPLPPADPADLVNYVTITGGCDEPVVVLAGCENTITLTPDAANPAFPVNPGDMGDAIYDIVFAHAGGPNCCPNVSGATTDLIVDGSFEAGPGGGAWTEASTNFGTPICDLGGCGNGTGTGPSDGNFWAWFGGIGAFEAGSVCQTVTVPANATALDLSFDLEMIVCDDPADFMEVTIDGTQVYFVDGGDAMCGVLGYTPIAIDLLAAGIAPGASYTLCFESEIFGTNGNGTNFFVDNVELISEEPAGIDPCVGSITAPYECSDVANIPTLSEWGLIVLALLLMTIGSLKMGVASFAGAGTSTIPVGSNFKLPFNNAILRKAFMITGIMAIIGFAVCFGIYGAIFMPDLIGVAIAGPIFAYLAHLLYLLETKKR